MKPKISVFIATSLDGFIARNDGSLDWLNNASASVPKGQDCGFQLFMDSIDYLIMGRNTFEQVLSFGEWPYGQKKMIVLTSRGIEIPKHLVETVSVSSEQPKQLVSRLSEQGAKHLYIDGGITIQSFLQAGLVDEITMTIIPIVLGEGKPLFRPVGKDLYLSHLETRSYDFGFVQLKYGIKEQS